MAANVASAPANDDPGPAAMTDPADYVTDAPIEREAGDRFDRAPFARRIASTILAQRDPASIVVGLYGPWGDGKTTVLNFVEERLRVSEQCVPVRFNPWQFDDEARLFHGFFETLAEALDASLTTTKEKAGDILRKYGGILKPLPFGDAAGELARVAGDSLATVNLTKLRQRIEAILASSGTRVVILIDDIDRLDKAEIQLIFRVVKVAADFRHTAYLLAFDEDVVAAALAERYSASEHHGSSFLEKIIQLPLHLPPVPDQKLRAVAFESVDVALAQANVDLSELEANRFAATFQRSAAYRMSTPRMAKRYGNAVLFALPAIGKEVNTVDLLLVEAMRIFFPELYKWVRSNEAEVLAERAAATDHFVAEGFASATKDLDSEQRRGAQVLLNELFPRTESAWQNKHWGSEWTRIWAKERRIATSQYFARYFTYTVPQGDVKDADIDTFVAMLSDPEQSIRDISTYASRLIVDGRDETLIAKLQQVVDDVSVEAASRASVVLTAIADEFSDRVQFLGLSTFERAAALVTKFLVRVAQDERVEVLDAVFRAANPLGFAVEVYRWAQVKVRAPQGDVDLIPPDALQDRLGPDLARRIAESWHAQTFFEEVGRRAAAGLHIWSTYAGRAPVRQALTAWVQGSSDNALTLIKSFLGSAWSLDKGVPIEAGVHRETYDVIAEFVDAGVVADALRSRWGSQIGTGDFYAFEALSGDERVATQFVFMHLAAMQQGRSEEDP